MYRFEMVEDKVSEPLLTLQCTFVLHCCLVFVVTRVVSVWLDLLAYIEDHAWLKLDMLIARPAAFVGRRGLFWYQSSLAFCYKFDLGVGCT